MVALQLTTKLRGDQRHCSFRTVLLAPVTQRPATCAARLRHAKLKLHTGSRNRNNWSIAAQQASYATPPSGLGNVDLELWEVLDLATEAELVALHNIMYGELAQPTARKTVPLWLGLPSHKGPFCEV